jgi:O-antigen ligase
MDVPQGEQFVEVDLEAATVAQSGSESLGDAHGRAYALGWGLFLAFVALTPLIIGGLPSQVGSLALFGAYDPVGLPKLVTLLVLSGASLAALCVSVARGESELYWHPVLWVLVALLGWAAISTVFSVSPWLSVWGSYYVYEGLVAILGYGLVAFLAMQYVRSTRDLRTVMVTAAVSGLLVSAYALMQQFGLDPFSWGGGETSRVFSTFGNADMLGEYLVFPLALAVGLALSRSRRWASLGWSLASVLIAAALVATLTRGAWLAASVMLVCMALAGWHGVWRGSRRRKLMFGGLAVAVIAATVVAIAFARNGFAGSSMTLSWLARASNGRTVIWLTGLRGWLTHPIAGWGPGGFVRAFESAVGADWYAIVPVGGTIDDAHSFLVQALVTLGIPGLLLMMWALVQTAIQSFHRLVAAKGHERLLSVALWGALVGMMTALTLGVGLPDVSVWLWLAVGLLLAPAAHRVPAPQRAVLTTAGVLGIAIALWAGSWLVADVVVGRAMKREAGPVQVSELETAVRLNPLSQNYREFVADALVNEALAGQRAGSSPQTVEESMRRAVSAYEAAGTADRGDMYTRVKLANLLVQFATVHPESDAARRAVEAAQDAVRLAPHNATTLVALARAYEAAGSLDEAGKTARLARSVAPAYAAQTLGSLGLDGASTP